MNNKKRSSHEVQTKPSNQNDIDNEKNRERESAELLKDLSTGNQRDERGFLSAVLDREKVTPEGLLHIPQT